MKRLRDHAGHLLMCAPMLIVAGVLLASGAGIAALVPAAVCVGAMTLMMGAMNHGGAERK